MDYRPYGNSGMTFSELCFGTMRFVPKDGKDADAVKRGQTAMREALDAGINTVHSSYEYGTRWAVGDVLKDHPKRHDILHVIKVPVPDYEDEGFDAAKFRDRIDEALRDMHAERIAIAQNLQRGVPPAIVYDAKSDPERIPALARMKDDMARCFEDLHKEGKVGALATFPHTLEYARAAVESDAFSGMVFYYNAVETELLDLFPEMAKRGQTFLSMRPYLEGLVTDRYRRRNDLPDGHRMREAVWEPRWRRFESLQEELGSTIGSWTAYAVKFALAHPVIASCIVSMNTPEQLHEALAAADGNYPDADTVERIHRLNQESDAA